jgi:hypothetical protein
MATPGELYGWFPGMNQPIPGGTDRWMTIPEAPNAMIGGMLGLPGQRGAMTEMAFGLAGLPRMKPGEGDFLPYTDYPSDDDGTGGGAPIAGDLNSLNSLYKQGSKLYEGLLGGGGVPAGASATDIASLGSAGLGSISGSALFGAGGASGALGATGPIAADTALANLGTVSASELFGASGSVAAGSGPGSLGMLGGNSSIGASGAGSGAAATGSGGGALASSGITTALPIAAAAWVAADLANKSLVGHGDEKRNQAAYSQAFPGATKQTVALGKAGREFGILPDGTVVDPRYYDRLAGAWYGMTYAPDGNQAYWANEYERLAANPVTAQLPKGYLVRDGKIVRG